MLTKTQALDEAKRQKQALTSLGKWRRNLFVFTACISGWVFGLGAAAAVVAGISFLLTLTVHLSIRNGVRNVEAILRTLA